MKTKTLIYSILIFIGLSIGQYFFYKYKNSFLEQENIDLQTEKEDGIKKVRDSAHAKIEYLTKISDEKFDSIINIPPTIKYIKYEKSVYPNRSLDVALDVHSKHKSDTRTK